MFARHLEKKSQNANSQTEKDDRTCSFAKIPHGILEFVATTAPRRRPAQNEHRIVFPILPLAGTARPLDREEIQDTFAHRWRSCCQQKSRSFNALARTSTN